MNSLTMIIILTSVFLATIVTAKPLIKQDSDLSNTSHFHKLIKRATNASKGSSKTGFAGIISTEGTRHKRKTRECEEWAKEPITNKWKCAKFIIVKKNN